MDIKINSEESALTALSQALGGKFSELEQPNIIFSNWPVIHINFKGAGYDSTITPELAEAIVELQGALNRSYSRLVHNQSNARSLKDNEKDKIRLKAKVQKGSTDLQIDLTQYLTAVTQQVITKMTPGELIVTVLGLGVTAGSVLAYKAYLANRAAEKKIDTESQQAIAMSNQETERLKIVTQALSSSGRLAATQQDFDGVRTEFMRSAVDADSITVQGVKVSSETARAIASTKREESQDIQLNGNYRILKVDHSAESEVKLGLSRIDDGLEFHARFRDQSLQQTEIALLQEAEWKKSKVYLSINATVLRGQITTASVVGVEKQPDNKK